MKEILLVAVVVLLLTSTSSAKKPAVKPVPGPTTNPQNPVQVVGQTVAVIAAGIGALYNAANPGGGRTGYGNGSSSSTPGVSSVDPSDPNAVLPTEDIDTSSGGGIQADFATV